MSVSYIGCNNCDTHKSQTSKVKAKENGKHFCGEEVHPGSGRTSLSVAWNQVPSHKLDF